MPVPQEYVLSFDLSELENQFSILNRSYTDFGKTIQDVTSKTKNDLREISETITEINSLLSTVTASLDYTFASLKGNVLETSHMFDDIAKFSKEAAENIEKIGAADIKLNSTSKGKEGVDDRLKDIHSMPLPTFSFETGGAGSDAEHLIELVETAKYVAEQAMKMAKDAKEEADKLEGNLKKALDSVKGYIDKEVKNASGAMGGLASRASMGVLGGGIVGGLLTAMIMGYTEKDRIRQETGEIINVFEGISDDFFSKQSKKAIGWFSKFQEKAQYFYGIGRQEVQGVLKQLVGAGYKYDEFMNRVDKRLGEVGSNIATLTLGIDKHFNLATGTSVQHMNEMVSMYGDTIGEATDKYTKLAFAAQRSGIGIENFINSVMAGSQAMSQYGIDVKEVVHVMQTLQSSYESMGAERQFAGGLAGRAVQGMLSGVSGMSEAFAVVISNRMNLGGGNAYEQIQLFKEGWRRAVSGEDDSFFIKVTREAAEFAKSQAGDRATQIKILEQQGLDNLAASAVIDFSNKFQEGTDIQAANSQEIKGLRNAFKTEGQQMSELQKNQRELIYGLSDIGQGMLKILSGIFGIIIAGVRAIPAFFTALSLSPKERDERFKQIDKALSAQVSSIFSGVEDVGTGFGKLGEVFGKQMDDMFGSIKEAVKFDIGMGGSFLTSKDLDEFAVRYTKQMSGLWANLMDELHEGWGDPWRNMVGRVMPVVETGLEIQKKKKEIEANKPGADYFPVNATFTGQALTKGLGITEARKH